MSNPSLQFGDGPNRSMRSGSFLRYNWTFAPDDEGAEESPLASTGAFGSSLRVNEAAGSRGRRGSTAVSDAAFEGHLGHSSVDDDDSYALANELSSLHDYSITSGDPEDPHYAGQRMRPAELGGLESDDDEDLWFGDDGKLAGNMGPKKGKKKNRMSVIKEEPEMYGTRVDEDDEFWLHRAPTEISRALTSLSLHCLHRRHPIRRTCAMIMTHRYFERAVLFFILCNTAIIAIQDPVNRDSVRNDIIDVADVVFTILFSIEALIKIIALGFVGHAGAYLRSGWNVLDFVVVVSGYAAFFVGEGVSGIRALRVLRPLRAVAGSRSLRSVVSSLLKSLPMLFHVFTISALFFSIFAIFGTQMFGGVLTQRCIFEANDTLVPIVPNTSTLPTELGICSKGGWQAGETCDIEGTRCAKYRGENPNFGFTSFDDARYASLIIFQGMTMEGWSQIMYATMDATMDLSAVYFVLTVIFGGFFIVNLTLVIINETFATVMNDINAQAKQEPLGGMLRRESLLSDGGFKLRKESTEGDKGNGSSALRLQLTRSLHSLRHGSTRTLARSISSMFLFQSVTHYRCLRLRKRYFVPLVDSNTFQVFVGVVIILNVVTLGLECHGEGFCDSYDSIAEVFNYVFTAFFVIEMLLKFAAFGIKGYFRARVNWFDFFIVSVSLLEIGLGDSSSLSGLRALRLLRVARLVTILSGLGYMFEIFVGSLAKVLSVSLLLFLILFVYALLGMQFYGGKFDADIRLDFDSLYRSMITVFVVLSGENWNEIMFDGMKATSEWASLYFVSLLVIGNMLLINLFIAITYQQFQEQRRALEEKALEKLEEAFPGEGPLSARMKSAGIDVDNACEGTTDEGLPQSLEMALSEVQKAVIAKSDAGVMPNNPSSVYEARYRAVRGDGGGSSPYEYSTSISPSGGESESGQNQTESESDAVAGRSFGKPPRPRRGSTTAALMALRSESRRRVVPVELTALSMMDGDVSDASDASERLLESEGDEGTEEVGAGGGRSAAAVDKGKGKSTVRVARQFPERKSSLHRHRMRSSTVVPLPSTSTTSMSASLLRPPTGAGGSASTRVAKKKKKSNKRMWLKVLKVLPIITIQKRSIHRDDESETTGHVSVAGSPAESLRMVRQSSQASLSQQRRATYKKYVTRNRFATAKEYESRPRSAQSNVAEAWTVASQTDGPDPHGRPISSQTDGSESVLLSPPPTSESGGPSIPGQTDGLDLPSPEVVSPHSSPGLPSLKRLNSGNKMPVPLPLLPPPPQSVSGSSEAGSEREGERERERGESSAVSVGEDSDYAEDTPSRPPVSLRSRSLRERERQRLISRTQSSSAAVVSRRRERERERDGNAETSDLVIRIPLRGSPNQNVESPLNQQPHTGESTSSVAKAYRDAMKKVEGTPSPSRHRRLFPHRSPTLSGKRGRFPPSSSFSPSSSHRRSKSLDSYLLSERVSISKRFLRSKLCLADPAGLERERETEMDAERGRMGDGEREGARPRVNESFDSDATTESDGKKYRRVIQICCFESGRDYSLGMFPPSNTLRQYCKRIVAHSTFEGCILFLIFLSSLALAFDTPGLSSHSTRAKVLNHLNQAFTVLFLVEMALKIVALGFAMNSGSYLRSRWNMLDFIIVLASTIDAFASSQDLGFFRVLRLLRALRPLRMISRSYGMRRVLDALVKSIPPLGNVLMFSMVFWLVYAILGVQLLAGKMGYCMVIADNSSSSSSSFAAVDSDEMVDLNRTECIAMDEAFGNVSWRIHNANFDNTAEAMLTLFQLSTLERWPDIMLTGVDAVGIDQPPMIDNSPAMALYFVFFVLIGSFVIMNLFISVLIDNYYSKREDGPSLVTEKQQSWVAMQRFLMNFRPPRVFVVPENGLRARLYYLVISPLFDQVYMAIVLINLAIMFIEHHPMSSSLADVLLYADYAFTSLFVLEAILKISGHGIQGYWSDGWNRFDFVLVIGSLVGLSLDVQGIASIFRLMRLIRFVRLIPGVRHLFFTVYFSLPALANVGSLISLLFFVYAIIGMEFFGEVVHQSDLNRHANFENFPRAILTLFRTATGEDWNAIMEDARVQSPDCDHSLSNCGSQWAVFYFVSFQLLGSFTLLNLFVAVICENFADTSSIDGKVDVVDIKKFSMVWATYDPESTHFVPAGMLPALLRDVGPPLVACVRDDRRFPNLVAFAFISTLGLPLNSRLVNYHKLLFSLIRRLMEATASQDMLDKTEENWQKYFRIRSESHVKEEQTRAQLSTRYGSDTMFDLTISDVLRLLLMQYRSKQRFQTYRSLEELD